MEVFQYKTKHNVENVQLTAKHVQFTHSEPKWRQLINLIRIHAEITQKADHLISKGVQLGHIAYGQAEKLQHLTFHVLTYAGYLGVW